MKSGTLFAPLLRQLLLGLALGTFGATAIAQTAVVVNNTKIPSARVDAFVKAMVTQGRPDTPELREMVREELISRELFVQEAESRKLPASDAVEAQLVRARQDILISALIRNELETNPITDKEIAAEYELQAKNQKGEKEYRARHILVEKEDEAKKVLASLAKGAKFEDLASKLSQDPGSAKRGGDLDWNRPDTFVPAFAEAMIGLKKSETTKKAVKTQFGYHIIELTDVREAEPPSLDSVRPQIKQTLERTRVTELQKSLRGKAVIK
jgi:peptidyl-prolyl cis-trans isomerase C